MVSDYTKGGGTPNWIKIKDQTQLSVVAKKEGRHNVLKFLVIALSGLNDALNVGKGMNDDQIVEIASDLLEDYYFYRLVDFSICFKNIRKGLYGKMYDRFDQETLYGMVAQYVRQ